MSRTLFKLGVPRRDLSIADYRLDDQARGKSTAGLRENTAYLQRYLQRGDRDHTQTRLDLEWVEALKRELARREAAKGASNG